MAVLLAAFRLDHPSARPVFGALVALLALQLAALAVWSLFLSVAHFGYPSYIKLMALAWLASGLLIALLPRWRWFCFAATAICLPRLAGIAINAPAHHLLFPWFAGMGLGLGLRLLCDWLRMSLRQSRSSAASATPEQALTEQAPAERGWPRLRRIVSGPGFALAMLAGLFVAALLRAYARFYGVDALLQLAPAIDREVTPGVSANYSLYLALLLFLNFAGPLLFIAAGALYDRAVHALHTSNRQAVSARAIAGQLMGGLTLGAGAQLVALGLQSMGLLRLAAGAGDHWQAAGRLPGILTDSGASTLLTPFLIATAVLLLYHQLARWIPAAQRGDLLRRYLLPAGVAVLIGVSVLVPISYHHGRAFFLGAGGALGLAALLLLVMARRTGVSAPAPRYWWLAAGVGALGLLALGALVAQSQVPAVVTLRDELTRMWPQIKAGHWNVALNMLDEGRAHYLRTGLALVGEAPWIGHGINSFQIELPRFQALAPRIASDNPGTLVLGLLSDFGLIGLMISGSWVLWPLLVFWRARRSAGTRTLWLLGLGIAFVPGSLIGFHLVLAEFTALLFVPYLCALALERQREPAPELIFAENRAGLVINAVAALALCVWCAAAVADVYKIA